MSLLITNSKSDAGISAVLEKHEDADLSKYWAQPKKPNANFLQMSIYKINELDVILI